jgi:hypothetical protein
MPEPAFQVSEKITDTAIFVVRGSTYTEFSNNLDSVVEDSQFRVDMDKFISTVTGKPMVSMPQAVANVQQSFPQAQVQQQGPPPQWAQQPQQGAAPWDQPQQQQFQQQPQQQTTGQTFTCPHGQRVMKSGTSRKGQWTAYFCPQKGTDCKPQNTDGTFWK